MGMSGELISEGASRPPLTTCRLLVVRCRYKGVRDTRIPLAEGEGVDDPWVGPAHPGARAPAGPPRGINDIE